MKRLSLIVAALAVMVLVAGCQKYDDSQIRQEIKELVDECYCGMFYGCSSLKNISVAFTDWKDGSATPFWVIGVPAEGTFECPENPEVNLHINSRLYN